MSYLRKTIDTYELWINYGQGFEHELTEESYKEIKDRLKEYRDNCPQYPVKMKRKRERKIIMKNEIIKADPMILMEAEKQIRDSNQFLEDRRKLEDIFRGLLRFNRVNDQDMGTIARLLAHGLQLQENRTGTEEAALQYFLEETRKER